MPNVCFCLRIGPLVCYWTMRYEGQYHFFKQLAQNIGNFINLCCTLALRHQLLQCYYHISQTSFLTVRLKLDQVKQHLIPEISYVEGLCNQTVYVR